MTFETLGDLVCPVQQVAPETLGGAFFMCVDITSVNQELKRIAEPRRLSVTGAPSRARQLIQDGDVLVSTVRPNLNAVALAGPEHSGAMASTGFCVLRSRNGSLDSGYLYFFTQSAGFVGRLVKIAAGASYPAVSDGDIKDCPIARPPIAEQRRIAAQLAEADHLRRMRRYALVLSDSLLEAAFLRMFGDFTDPTFTRANVSQLGRVQTGNTPPRDNETYYGDALEWIKSDDIGLQQLHPARASEGLSITGASLGRVAEAGSTLVTCIAGSVRSIGNVALTNRRVAFNQQINAVSPRADVHPSFLYGLLRTAKPLIQRRATSAMKKMVTKGALESLVLIKPSFVAQERFAIVVEQHERLRAQQREALRQAEHLFQTLLHRAFT